MITPIVKYYKGGVKQGRSSSIGAQMPFLLLLIYAQLDEIKMESNLDGWTKQYNNEES